MGEEIKGFLILIGIILCAGLNTCLIAYLLYKKSYKSKFAISAIPGIITSLIIAFTIIPYGLSYPDPVGSGLTVFFAIGLMIGSNILGFLFAEFLRK